MRMCEHRRNDPTIQDAKRAQESSRRELRHIRKVQVNMAPAKKSSQPSPKADRQDSAPATGYVLAISPRIAAIPHMKMPDKGQAKVYIEPPPLPIAVINPNTVPASPQTSSAPSWLKAPSHSPCRNPMLHTPIPQLAQKSKSLVSSSSNPSAASLFRSTVSPPPPRFLCRAGVSLERPVSPDAPLEGLGERIGR